LEQTLAVQAKNAYNAGAMQYTIRNVPKDLDQVLRRTAREQGKSLNQVAVESLRAALGVSEGSGKRRDLSDLVGAGRIDSAVQEALDDQRRIDPDLWE
jgi:plasmid stability protein